MRLVLCLIATLLVSDVALARGRGRQQTYYQQQTYFHQQSYSSTTTVSASASNAQGKAEILARMGSVFHPGGGFGGGAYEGCGMGATQDAAIRNCCYWGQLTPIQIGTAQGANGWFAVVFYR